MLDLELLAGVEILTNFSLHTSGKGGKAPAWFHATVRGIELELSARGKIFLKVRDAYDAPMNSGYYDWHFRGDTGFLDGIRGALLSAGFTAKAVDGLAYAGKGKQYDEITTLTANLVFANEYRRYFYEKCADNGRSYERVGCVYLHRDECKHLHSI